MARGKMLWAHSVRLFLTTKKLLRIRNIRAIVNRWIGASKTKEQLISQRGCHISAPNPAVLIIFMNNQARSGFSTEASMLLCPMADVVLDQSLNTISSFLRLHFHNALPIGPTTTLMRPQSDRLSFAEWE